jgi:hypothetical protein
MENGGEMDEIHPISMIFMKLAVSHSVLHQKTCSWACFKRSQVEKLLPVPIAASTLTRDPYGYEKPMHFPICFGLSKQKRVILHG